MKRLLMIAIALALGWAAPPDGEETAHPDLALRLKAPKKSQQGDSVIVRVGLENLDPARVTFILKSVIPPAFDLRSAREGTYIWPFQVLSFEVRSRDGKAVPYRGGVPLELTPPSDCELIALGPGESYTWIIRLDRWYDLTALDEYSIEAVLSAQTRGWFLAKHEKEADCMVPSEFSHVIEGTFRSNVVHFEMEQQPEHN